MTLLSLARLIAASEGQHFDLLPVDAADFIRRSIYVSWRDPGTPFQCDYVAAAAHRRALDRPDILEESA